LGAPPQTERCHNVTTQQGSTKFPAELHPSYPYDSAGRNPLGEHRRGATGVMILIAGMGAQVREPNDRT